MADTDQMRAALLKMSNSVAQVAINGFISCSPLIDRCTYLVKMQPRKSVSLKANFEPTKFAAFRIIWDIFSIYQNSTLYPGL